MSWVPRGDLRVRIQVLKINLKEEIGYIPNIQKAWRPLFFERKESFSLSFLSYLNNKNVYLVIEKERKWRIWFESYTEKSESFVFFIFCPEASKRKKGKQQKKLGQIGLCRRIFSLPLKKDFNVFWRKKIRYFKESEWEREMTTGGGTSFQFQI